jgi:hypothetical protein
MMFVHYNGRVVNSNTIEFVEYGELVNRGYIAVHTTDGKREFVEGPVAFDLVMRLCPDALEGERAKYHRHAWAIHNLFGHPLMQIFSWLGLPQLGIKIHDMTAPFPITK